MHLPRFWAKETRSALDPSGKAYALAVWGWSDQDSAGARQMAVHRLAELARKVELGSQLNRYGYGGGERPLREPLIQPVPGAEALISRNAYGALVLNTAHVFFADIDLPEPASGGLLAGLFGKKPTDPAEAALARLREWQARQPEWALRIYRTKAGLRLLATHDQLRPGLQCHPAAARQPGQRPALHHPLPDPGLLSRPPDPQTLADWPQSPEPGATPLRPPPTKRVSRPGCSATRRPRRASPSAACWLSSARAARLLKPPPCSPSTTATPVRPEICPWPDHSAAPSVALSFFYSIQLLSAFR